MKWYSVKEHKIPFNMGFVFVGLSVGDSCAYSIAEFRYNPSSDEDVYEWFGKNNHTLAQVTHFCIPDPLPNSM